MNHSRDGLQIAEQLQISLLKTAGAPFVLGVTVRYCW